MKERTNTWSSRITSDCQPFYVSYFPGTDCLARKRPIEGYPRSGIRLSREGCCVGEIKHEKCEAGRKPTKAK